MIFGNPAAFAIETGDIEDPIHWGGLFIQFRFWIDSHPIGDWEDRIPLVASIEYARILCNNEAYRRQWLFKESSPEEIFRIVYDQFFECEYSKAIILNPNLRDRFHLDDIGMGAIQDKYGLIVVMNSFNTERIIVKDLRDSFFLADVSLHFGLVESALNHYVEWGQSQVHLEQN